MRRQSPSPQPSPELVVSFSRRSDGDVVLRCERRDGSATWQRQHGRNASFFAIHDLTHFAVESVLGFREGFFGLIASGWAIEDTGGKSARGALPDDAAIVEHLVGMFDLERAHGTPWSAEEINAALVLKATNAGRRPPRRFTDEELDRARDRVRELHRQWFELPMTESMSLPFIRGAPVS